MIELSEYTRSAAVGQLDATSAKIKIVEGTNPQPTVQPTPATPGFGALAALAGLGAVAVLLLRRE